MDEWATIDELIRKGKLMEAIAEARINKVTNLKDAHRIVIERRDQLLGASGHESNPEQE